MAPRLAKKVLLIGWDAADWKLINPLLDSGKMPFLESVVSGGVMGNLTTLRPILSPLLWNSISTGKRADKHGILDFFEPDPHIGGIRPVSSTSRKVKAIWNILTQRGFHTHVVGWFAGHPAEPINGVCVSPLYPIPLSASPTPWPLPEGSVHPASLRETFAALRVHPAELTAEELLPFVPRAAEVDQKNDRALESLAKVLAECCSIHNAATWILENREWDFLAVFYNAIDHFCHRFMPYYPPAMPGVSERDFEIYKDVVPSAYRLQDLLLGRLLALAGPDTTVMIVSDHGFHSDDLRPRNIVKEPAGNTAWHRPIGIVCLKGPGIRKDERVYGTTLLDIAPTLLTLFGLPVGQDMDGRLMTQALENPVQPDSIPSWEDEPGECGMHPAALRVDPAAAQAVLQQFVALGYMEPPGEDRDRAVASVLREHKYNLARVYLESLRPAEALPLLEQLSRDNPDQLRFALELARCYLALGRLNDAREVLLARAEQGSQPWADWLLGVTYSEQGDNEMAMPHLLQAEKANPRLPDLHLRIAATYRQMSRLTDARRAYQRALELDGDNPTAFVGLAMISLAERRYREAAEQALVAVGLDHYMPLAHYLLGVALARLRQFDRSVIAFETALSILPGYLKAHRWLATIHSRPGGDPIKAAAHRSAAEELRRQRLAQGVR
jgi:predicted AlkP superfamily phosphohydrolase/phosphomutase/tetratricopeptide (TPR) repeat protein